MEQGTPVVVTTEYRGVFFGYVDEINKPDRTVRLTQARNCVYWPASVRGFLGLAAKGPDKGCRVGPAAESVYLVGVTCVARASESSVKAWEAGPWS